MVGWSIMLQPEFCQNNWTKSLKPTEEVLEGPEQSLWGPLRGFFLRLECAISERTRAHLRWYCTFATFFLTISSYSGQLLTQNVQNQMKFNESFAEKKGQPS